MRKIFLSLAILLPTIFCAQAQINNPTEADRLNAFSAPDSYLFKKWTKDGGTTYTFNSDGSMRMTVIVEGDGFNVVGNLLGTWKRENNVIFHMKFTDCNVEIVNVNLSERMFQELKSNADRFAKQLVRQYANNDERYTLAALTPNYLTLIKRAYYNGADLENDVALQYNCYLVASDLYDAKQKLDEIIEPIGYKDKYTFEEKNKAYEEFLAYSNPSGAEYKEELKGKVESWHAIDLAFHYAYDEGNFEEALKQNINDDNRFEIIEKWIKVAVDENDFSKVVTAARAAETLYSKDVNNNSDKYFNILTNYLSFVNREHKYEEALSLNLSRSKLTILLAWERYCLEIKDYSNAAKALSMLKEGNYKKYSEYESSLAKCIDAEYEANNYDAVLQIAPFVNIDERQSAFTTENNRMLFIVGLVFIDFPKTYEEAYDINDYLCNNKYSYDSSNHNRRLALIRWIELLFKEEKFQDCLIKSEAGLLLYPDNSTLISYKHKSKAYILCAEAEQMMNEGKKEDAIAKLDRAFYYMNDVYFLEKKGEVMLHFDDLKGAKAVWRSFKKLAGDKLPEYLNDPTYTFAQKMNQK